MPDVLVKPEEAIWQQEEGPPGCRLYLLLHEGGGRVARDLSRRSKDGTFISGGSPTLAWQRGRYGAQLGGFSTTDYLQIDPPTQITHAVYPCWMAVLAINTNTADGALICAAGTAADTQFAAIRYNRTSTGTLAYTMVDDSGTAVVLSVSGLSVNDGQPHVAMAWSLSASDHRLAWDGAQVASSTSTLGTTTFNALTLGALRRNTIVTSFGGSLIVASAGRGSVPDPKAFAQDLLSGELAAVRQRPRRVVVAVPATAIGTGLFTMGHGFADTTGPGFFTMGRTG